MDEAGWPMAGRAFPGPLALALWIAVTVTLPLVYFEATHRWEENQNVSTALWWTLGAMPLLAATASARWWTEGTQRLTGLNLLTAMAAGTLVSAVFLVGSLAVYRWIIPLGGTTDWWATFIGGLGLAVAGTTIGSLIGPIIRQLIRWLSEGTGWRRTISVLAAAAIAMLVGAAFLVGSLAFYRWVIPFGTVYDRWEAVSGLPLVIACGVIGYVIGRAAWPFLAGMTAGAFVAEVVLIEFTTLYQPVTSRGLPTNWWDALWLAIVGAIIGYLIGLRTSRDPNDRPAWHGYLLGAIVAVAGALLAPMTVQLGAEDSTVSSDYGRYGGVGEFAAVGGQGVLTLPAAGQYAIYAVGFSPDDPDCRVTGPRLAEQRADLIAAPPSDYGSDAATLAWVATFSVPDPGTYSLTCRTGEGPREYAVGGVPAIRGAVGALIHWPLALLWLLGSIPGLLIIVSTIRRARRLEDRAPAESPDDIAPNAKHPTDH